ncbi:MAG: hypothetical protein ACHQ03_08505 [Candidatus Bathyarchaeia archaeon]
MTEPSLVLAALNPLRQFFGDPACAITTRKTRLLASLFLPPTFDQE